MAVVKSYTFGQKLCKILNLDGTKVRGMEIHVEVDDVIYVKVERFIHKDEGEEILSLLEKYKLVEKELVREERIK